MVEHSLKSRADELFNRQVPSLEASGHAWFQETHWRVRKVSGEDSAVGGGDATLLGSEW